MNKATPAGGWRKEARQPLSLSAKRYRATHREQHRAYMKIYNATHRKERRIWERAYRAANITHVRAYTREYARIRKYGASPEWVAKTLIAQENACAICARPITSRANIDHDHATGATRGMLCGRCNTRLATVEDPEWVARAQAYLDYHALAVSAARPANEPSRPDVLAGRAAVLARASKRAARALSPALPRATLFGSPKSYGVITVSSLRGATR